jgi:hypothetical protein
VESVEYLVESHLPLVARQRPHVGRYVTRDVEYHGRQVPANSAMMVIAGGSKQSPWSTSESTSYAS